MSIEPKADYLFECSWEVCNKVGGIYTVLISKSNILNKLYRNYFLIGPYFEDHARFDYVEKEPPTSFKRVFESLKKEGIKCYFGEWQIKGNPKVILIDFKGFIPKKNELKTKYWEDYKIDSLNSDWMFDEPMLWATTVGILLEKLRPLLKGSMVAHFHEWMSGFALLYLKPKNLNIKTVFTTHATMLGRALAGSNRDFYNELDSLKPEEEAYNSNVQDKYLTEKACAFNTDVFTTVSQITALEVDKLLGKKPDVILFNGLDRSEFPTQEEVAVLHRKHKKSLYEFVKYFFFPYYSFDLKETLFFFIAGRYEYHNKGLDILTKAFGDLNRKLKKEKSNRTIVVFYFIPRDTLGIKPELSENKMTYEYLKDLIEDNVEDIEEHVLNEVLTTNKIRVTHTKLLREEVISKLKKLKYKLSRQGPALLSTHNIPNENGDLIIRGFVDNDLKNREDDRIKVVDYPVYLTGVDGLLNLSYYNTITAFHFGLFPSYYEPWGYTPLETASLGVPSLTTDLAGFGRFVLSNNIHSGVFVLRRFNKSEKEVVLQLRDIMYNFLQLSKQERSQQKLDARAVSKLTDWKDFIKNYIKAHNLALDQ